MKRPASSDDVQKVAHDFNNLLTAIIGAADAILERAEIDPETRADIAHVREGARRGTTLVQRLRGTTQDATEPPGLISVNQTIRATWRLLDHSLGPNISLALDLGESGEQVRIDPSQLDRAMLNLIANARHAMPDGGTVTLGTSRRVVEVAESRVPDTIPPGIYAVIAVTDGGAGIPPGQMSRIFEAGFSSRRRAGGSGIGLSSTRDIVRRCNGFLSVESVEGKGTRFEIYLPHADDACALAARSAGAPTVLLVEDDLLVRRVAERTLHRAGWNVLSAGSAEAALDVLGEANCDLLISDITLPCMDGAALARLVLARHPGTPVVLTSGYARTTVAKPETVADAVFLTKPYGQAELLDLVAAVIARKTAGA